MITRDDVMAFFREGRQIEELSRDDMVEIALDCVAYSDWIYEALNMAIDEEANYDGPSDDEIFNRGLGRNCP